MGFLVTGALLLGDVSVWYLKGPSELETALTIAFLSILTPWSALVVKVMKDSLVGGIPVSKVFNGGIQHHLVEHPETIPEPIVQAAIEREQQSGNIAPVSKEYPGS